MVDTMKSDAPFASEAAEKAFQSAVKAGAKINRDQFRAALQTFTTEEAASKKRYDEWSAEQAAEKAKEEAKKWFPISKKPKKPGAYNTAKRGTVHLGFAMGWWTGKEWHAYKDWGDYSKNPTEFLWRGQGPKNTDPIDDVPK